MTSLRGVRHADLALAALVVAIVAMMIVPLPTALIDLFIALNLTLGILLLGTALYVRDVTSFAAFPTVILLSTLYRLALNVSSTRLILLQADAGRVIEAFGNFVVRGDYLVGALVFLVLTVVQFLVIARGAERVAEVGARFSLDAMPGKQMAIDAELRSGSLSAEASRARRRALERESQLYGAMDGAMKFVKGDAIASIVITAVNFLGGVVLGVTSRDLPLEKSLTTYGLLTIGDGLVTQIPALLCSTAAGLVVTRVASEHEDGSLGIDIAHQLFADARVLSAAVLLLTLLAIVPGLPAWPFALMAVACAVLLARARRQARPRQVLQRDGSAPREQLTLELSPDLASAIAPELDAALARVQAHLDRELGLELPHVHVRAVSNLAPSSFRLVWREIEGTTHAAQSVDPISEQLLLLTRQHAEDLVSLEHVQRMLERTERESPALVRLTVPRPVSPTVLAQVLRVLAREGVSVRWLSEILEAIAPLAKPEARPEQLAEVARRALSRRISRALAPQGALHVLRLSPEIEEAVADAIKRDGEREWLALAPALARDIARAVTAAHTRAPHPHALLTDATLRPHVRALVAEAAPALPVVSAYELAPQVQLHQGERIGP